MQVNKKNNGEVSEYDLPIHKFIYKTIKDTLRIGFYVVLIVALLMIGSYFVNATPPNATLAYNFSEVTGNFANYNFGSSNVSPNGGYYYQQNGIIGYGINGSDFYGSLAYTGIQTGDFTIELWLKPITTGDQIIIGSDTGYWGGLRLNNGGAGTIQLSVNGNALNTTTNNSYVNTGTWHQYVITRSGNNFVVYHNGTSILTKVTADVFHTGNLRLGYASSYGIRAGIDEFRVWDGTALNSSQVLELYNNGAGLVYPFSGNVSPVSDLKNITFNANNIYNTSFFIDNYTLEFNYNGTNYSTSNGSIYLLNYNTSLLINVSLKNANNHVNVNYSNINLSNGSYTFTTTNILNMTSFNILTPINTSYEYNKSITLNWSTPTSYINTSITSYNISLLNSDGSFNKTINNSATLTTQSYNISTLPLGKYYIKIVAKDYYNLTNTNTSSEFYITSLINLRLKNAFTSVLVNNFTGWIYNIPTGINQSFNTTANLTTEKLYSGLNTIYLESNLYSISANNYYNYTINTTGATYNYNFSQYTSNSIYITIKDETTFNTINQSIVLDVQYLNATINTTTTTNGVILLDNLLDGEYTLIFRGDFGINYTTRTYVVTVASRSTQNLIAYLSNSGTTVLLSLTDSYTNQIIDGATISLYKNINNTYTLIEIKNSDITGRAQFVYVPLTAYRFVVQKTGYNNKIFDLNPIIFTSYDVPLDRLIAYTYTGSQENVKILYSPHQYFANETTIFSFIISSADGVLNSYGINLSYPCGNKSFSGNNSIGETFNTTFGITCAGFRDTINLTYWYVVVGQSQRTYNEMYYISGSYSGNNFTWVKIGQNSVTYGLGDLERIFIVTILVLIVAGTTYLMIGGIGSLAMALLIFGYFSYTGFIPFWSIAISVIAGIFMLIGGKE